MARSVGFNEYKIIGDVTILYLTNAKKEVFECLIDTEDLEKIKSVGFKVTPMYTKVSKRNYARLVVEKYTKDGKTKYKRVYLHKFITNTKPHEAVDHINNNALDNRKKNLRVTKQVYNTKNRKGKNSNNTSGYRNVCWVGNRWIVQLQIDGVNTKLGSFDDVHEAGKYAEEMRKYYYKDFAGKP